jgi:hypothetical protein
MTVKNMSNSTILNKVNTNQLPAGAVLQVVSTTKTDTFTTTSSSFTALTGLTASITPGSSSNKILVFIQLSYSLPNGEGFGHFKLSGGNTGTYIGDTASNRVRAVFGGNVFSNTHNALVSGSLQFLDSPATTASTTYGLDVRQATDGEVNINKSAFDADSVAHARGASTITLMEVAG